MKVTNSFTLETSMYAKTLTRAMMTEDPAAAGNSASIQAAGEKAGLTHVQLQLTDMH